MVDRDMKNASAFGLSKELNVPVAVKLCYLQATEVQQEVKMLAKPSEKYSNPQIFRKLSHIYFNSDLIVKIELFDGSNNLMTVPTQTMHHSFTNNKRMWNIYLRMAINYNQLSVNSYLKFTLYEIVNSEYVEFGTGRLGIFKDETLRMGLQKVGIVRVPNDGVSGGKLGQFNEETGPLDVNNDNSNEDCACGETETKLFQYQDGKMPKVPWLDTLSLPLVEKKRDTELKGCPFFLYIELPKFQLPIVYSDVTFQLPDTAKITQEFIENRNSITDPNINLVINKVETDTPGVYDPDFHLSNLDLIGGSVNYLDPIESKFHKLERNMNNSTLLDKELKPTPQLRDELLKILERPSNIELSDVEKNLIWKFRYYFSKNNTAAGGGISAAPTSQAGDPNSESFKINQKFLTKFLKSINWDNDYELNHTFNEIIPYYWSVDKIQIGDALELLSSYFNPLTLVKHASVQQESTDDQKESRIDMIFRYVRQLRNFAVNRLRKASGDELLLYLLQLVQALKYEALIVDTEINTVTDLDGGMDDIISTRNNDDKGTDSNDSKLLEKSPLALFLIEKSVENEKLGNFFYWFVKVENEDQINTGSNSKIYSIILNKYIEEVKRYSSKNKLPNYNYLKRQVWFIKKLTGLVELLRNTFKKNEATTKKIQFLREYLADSSNEFLKFPHSFPLPLDPSVMICGCYPEESSVFKSSLQPLKLTFKTVIKDSNQIFGDRRKKYGKYTMMFKIGDDLRQDQLVIQIINLMDQLLKNENLDLKLTPYRILATSPIAGMIQFVPNETLDSILAKNYGDTIGSTAITTTTTAINNNTNNGILNYLILHSQESQPIEPVEASVLGSISSEMTNSSTSNNTNLNTNKNVDQKHTVTSDLGVSPILMDNYVKSCAGYCVITYLLGVGDRHLDNLLLSPNGKFWHADFGYILGRDPKPFPPLMKLPIQVIDGMGGLNHENFSIFKNYCFVTYTTLRKNSNLILNLFQLMLDANIPDIKMDPTRAVEKVQEKFCLEMTEEEAILHFQNLINDSVNAFLPVVIDRLHSLAQYWRA